MTKSKFAFGEFTFDPDTGTLTRRNRDQRLAEQTARLLAILLERANTLVTRDELRRVLWPKEEFLDYDQGINVAVNRLRISLRDDSRSPQFLKTIPKRGYSFSGKVTLIPRDTALAEVPIHPDPINSSLISSPKTISSVESQAPDEVKQPLSLSSAAELRNETQSLTAAPEATAAVPEIPEPSRPLSRRGSRWRGLALSLAAVAIVLIAAILWIANRRAVLRAEQVVRLGIASFQVSGEPRAGGLGEGFRLSLSDAISRLPKVQVCAVDALKPAQRNTFDFPFLTQQLNLDDILLGSILKQGDEYDLKFELVRAADSVHLASFEYSGSKQDLPSIRDRLQHDIFYYLQSRAATVQAINGSTNDPEAYKYYLQGLQLMPPRSNPSSLNQAQSAFQQAIAHDPNFAGAYAGIATAYLRLSFYNTANGELPLHKAQDFARQAIRLDPVLAQAHAVLGFAEYAQDWNSADAESELRSAIQLDPSQADYHDWLGLLLTTEGRFDEGLQQVALAHANDPRWPSVYSMESILANFARRDQQAIAAGKTYLSLLPNLPLAHNTMAWTDFKAGRYQDAIAEWRQMAVLQNDTARVEFEDKAKETLKTKGIRAYAQLHLDAIQNKRGTGQWNDFIPAEWDACAGKREESIAQLEQLANAHSIYVLQIAVDPLYDSFHQDPRYLTLLNRLGLRVPPTLQGVNSHLCDERP
jgi:DNA-binding winged helix-turn-helix (wHTH) protein/Tfp pilus assembly protein PilF/TolB-like protein